jgi:hypothetical protein
VNAAAMRHLPVIVLAAVVVGYFALCFPRRVETYRGQFVTGGELVRPITAISVHSSSPNYLTVFGRTYRDVQGLKPFYLDIPSLDSILFVTGDDDQTFHLVNLRTKKHSSVHTSKTSFGAHIGSNRPPGEPYVDFVESVTNNSVVVATQYPNGKKFYFLDFGAGTLDRIVYDEYKGNVTNRSVYVDGKKVN